MALEIVLEFEEFLREAHRVDVIPTFRNRAADVVDPCRIHGRQIGYFARERLQNLGALAQLDAILLPPEPFVDSDADRAASPALSESRF